jgi:hypothetical protein
MANVPQRRLNKEKKLKQTKNVKKSLLNMAQTLTTQRTIYGKLNGKLNSINLVFPLQNTKKLNKILSPVSMGL